MGTSDRLQVFTGTANPALAQAIAGHLGIPLGAAMVNQYRNGETRVCIEESVRGADVFVVQPTCHPVNHHLMELLIMVDAIKRASASRITAVIPYYGYAKQEKKSRSREPITAKLVADLLQVAGVHRVLTCDLHAPAIEGFFDIPVDHLQGRRLLADRCRQLDLPNPVVVAPDQGRVGWAMEMRERLGSDADLALIAKQRPTADKAYAVEMVGDVRGKTALLIDDMIMTGGTLIAAAEMLLNRGARAVYSCATHAAFAPGTREILEDSPFTRVLVTDTVPLQADGHDDNSKLEVISVAQLFADAMLHIHEDRSVSALFR
ncbi:MAG: ribose-phosphate pyrophosphokinase [Chloroflexota bacterium]|nr:ribose-phosphate pyrophosphokinase [Chloroflexota bacterium]